MVGLCQFNMSDEQLRRDCTSPSPSEDQNKNIFQTAQKPNTDGKLHCITFCSIYLYLPRGFYESGGMSHGYEYEYEYAAACIYGLMRG